MANPIITLTTDYGTNDHLVGTLKGVLLKINPELTIVDITHNVNVYDLLDGALTIGAAYSYFPARTIHLVVVDPGVGTERRPLLVTAQNQYFVAPDNGVLSLIYEREQDNLGSSPGYRGTLFSSADQQDVSWARYFCAGGCVAFERLANCRDGRRDSGFPAVCFAAREGN